MGSCCGDGSNGAADHALKLGEMSSREAVELAPPVAGERAAYKRAISRAYAEWPLVEVAARVVVERGAFQFVRLTAGGVAPVPVRLAEAEKVSQGAPVSRRLLRWRLRPQPWARRPCR